MDDLPISLELDLSFSNYISDFSSRNPNLQSLSLLTSPSAVAVDTDTIISELVELVVALGTPGPCRRISERRLIGAGAQFRVFEDNVIFPESPKEFVYAAIKIPQFMLDAEKQLDISDSRGRRHVRALLTEIVALSHPGLQGHPNIVSLVGWGFDEGSWHIPPFLALELASSDLQILLDEERFGSWQEARGIMVGIGSGLDALHDVGLLHGDLKPGNVLMFREGGLWVPRLADFGGATGLKHSSEFLCQGTMGWRAPELRRHHEEGAPLDPSRLAAIDVWACGLMVWAVLCGGDSPPRGSETDAVVENAMTDLEKRSVALPDEMYNLLRELLPRLLGADPQERPARMEGLLSSHIAEASLAHDMKLLDLTADEVYNNEENTTDDAQEGDFEIDAPGVYFSWELPEVHKYFTSYLVSSSKRVPKSLSPPMTFSTFLSIIDHFRCEDHSRLLVFSPERAAVLRQMLTTCADEGLSEARAIFFLFHESVGLPVEEKYLELESAWAYESIASGALFLLSGRALGQEESLAALRGFQETCGYNRHYSDTGSETVENAVRVSQTISPGDLSQPRYQDLLHALASSSRPDALRKLKKLATRENIDDIATSGETMLYRACLAGCHETVTFLLSLGADPTIAPDTGDPTCLHWIVTFLPEHMSTVISLLTAHGADMHAISRTRVKLPHFPFEYPPGTPLHWALEFRSYDALNALLEHGADPLARDGLRNLTFTELDPDFRPESVEEVASSLGGVHVGPVEGSSALDVAVRNWDAFAVEMVLRRLETSGGACSAVEAGPGAFHELLCGDWRWTNQSFRFCNRMISGPWARRRRYLGRIISLLKGFGFDIDHRVAFLEGERAGTALMLAVELHHVEVAEALLEGRADPNAVDDGGSPALMYIGGGYGTRREAAYEAWKEQDSGMAALLLRYGADAGASDAAGLPAVVALANRTAVASALLRGGADIEARSSSPTQPYYGQTVLASVFKRPGGENPGFTTAEIHDKSVMGFLRQHLLPRLAGPGGAKTLLRDHGLDKADLVGGTLLHYAATQALPGCCGVLLDAGADVDAVLWRRHAENEAAYATPLDLVIREQAHFRRQIEIYNLKGMSRTDIQTQLEFYEKTVGLLVLRGGKAFSELADGQWGGPAEGC